MKKESQPPRQHQQQEQHPYVSLYEPLLLTTAPAEDDAFPLSSRQQQQPEKTSSSFAVAYQSPLFATKQTEFGACPLSSSQQQPEEVSSSSTAAVANQSRPSPRSRLKKNTTTSICRAKKRQKMNSSDDNSNIITTDNALVQSVVRVRDVHEEDAKMNLNDQVAHIVKTFLDDDDDDDNCRDSVTDCRIDDNDDDSNSDFRDDEAAIERMKVKSKLRAVVSTTATTSTPTTTTQRMGDKNNCNYTDPSCYAAATTTTNTNTNSKNNATWEEMYKRLVAYKKEHKDTTNVPQQYYKEDLHLGHWVNNQHAAYRKKTMTEERKRLLNSIDFVWSNIDDTGNNFKPINRNDARWMETYQRLVAYKKENKHTRVPQHNDEDPQLGAWINTQRCVYKKKKMTEERKRLLNSVSFIWDNSRLGKNEYKHPNDARWEEIYQRLVAYQKEHKDTRVPQKYKQDPQLGTWVNNQRSIYKKNKMTEERKLLLDSIFFA